MLSLNPQLETLIKDRVEERLQAVLSCSQGNIAAQKTILSNQELLARVAIEDKDESVRRAAIDKLADQELLAKVAIETKHLLECEVAMNKLTNQELLATVTFYLSMGKVAQNKLTHEKQVPMSVIKLNMEKI